MASLQITLTDGFAGDEVAISVDGREAYRKAGVKTDLRISRADGIEVEAADGGTTVEVTARGHTATARIDPTHTPFAAVSLSDGGRPEIRTSAEPVPLL